MQASVRVNVGWHAGFSTNIAVALSNITIVGGSIANFAINVGKRHHFMDRPLIDWDLIVVMEPATILGALAGGYLNRVRSLAKPNSGVMLTHSVAGHTPPVAQARVLCRVPPV